MGSVANGFDVIACGIAQGLVSSGDSTRVRRELGDLGVERFFRAVVCGGETARRKPHPEPLLLAPRAAGRRAERRGLPRRQPQDVTMAKAAGAFAVGIPGGFPNREALVRSGPDALVASLDAALKTLLG